MATDIVVFVIRKDEPFKVESYALEDVEDAESEYNLERSRSKTLAVWYTYKHNDKFRTVGLPYLPAIHMPRTT
jgi:hypothetical protein